MLVPVLCEKKIIYKCGSCICHLRVVVRRMASAIRAFWCLTKWIFSDKIIIFSAKALSAELPIDLRTKLNPTIGEKMIGSRV